MADTAKLHDLIAAFYGRRARRGGGCHCNTPKGAITPFAGYGADDLAALPEDAAANAFGCGNPIASSAVREGDVVLDLGSGAGIDLIIAARRVGPEGRVVGVDMTDEMIERARANIAAAGLANVEVRKGLIESLPVGDASVDWVISNCVINLSPDKPAVFAEIFRVLRPGGRMLVSDIVVERLPDWVCANEALDSVCVAGAIGESDYVAGLRAAGLGDVEVRDRLVYDAGQIESLYRSELADPAAPPGGASETLLHRAAAAIAGKVWSASIYARKPSA